MKRKEVVKELEKLVMMYFQSYTRKFVEASSGVFSPSTIIYNTMFCTEKNKLTL